MNCISIVILIINCNLNLKSHDGTTMAKEVEQSGSEETHPMLLGCIGDSGRIVRSLDSLDSVNVALQ